MSEKYNWSFLKETREDVGLTLREVEDITGISNAYLSQLESGKINRPSVQFVYTLAKAYGLDVETMLLSVGIIKAVDIEERVRLHDRVKKLEQQVLALQSKISITHDKF